MKHQRGRLALLSPATLSACDGGRAQRFATPEHEVQVPPRAQAVNVEYFPGGADTFRVGSLSRRKCVPREFGLKAAKEETQGRQRR
jgi:hypothetical protein